MRTVLYYTLYNELLELNPEKPKEVKEEQTVIYGNISIQQKTGAELQKNLKKGGKNAKDKISHI